jgi:hypothetical protein
MKKIDDPVPKNADQANKIVAGRSPIEAALFFPVPIILLTLIFSLGFLSVPVFGACLLANILISSIIFQIIPRGESALSWLDRAIGYHRRYPVSAHPNLFENETSLAIRADGGTDAHTVAADLDADDFDLSPWEEYNPAPDITGIKRIFPDKGYILRDDGRLIGLIEVHGRDVLLSESATSGRITQSYEQVLSRLQNRTDFHIVSNQFDIDEHIQHHQERLDDEDMAHRPLLRECARDYIQFAERNVRNMNLMQRQVFAKRSIDTTTASSDETESPFAGIVEPDSPLGKLLNAGTETEDDSLEAFASDLERELLQLESTVQNIQGVKTSRVTGETLVELLHNHWNPEYGFHFAGVPDVSPVTTDLEGSELPNKKTAGGQVAPQQDVSPSPAPTNSDVDPSEPEDGSEAADSLYSRLTTSTSGLFSSTDKEEDDTEEQLPSKSELEKGLTSSSRVHEYKDHVVLNGSTYARTYIVEEWPRNNTEFMLLSLLSDGNLEFSMTLRVNPLDETEAVSRFGSLADSFEDKAEGALSAYTLNPEAAKHSAETCRNLKVAIQNGNQAGVEVGLVVTVYADSLDHLDDLDSALTHRLVGDAGVGLSKAVYEQQPALKANSPIGPSTLLDQADGRWQIMGSKAAAGTFTFISDALMELGGVNLGANVAYNTPTIMDIWNRNKGYNILRVGDIGSGKSFAAGLFDLRSAYNNPNLNIAIIDPLEGEYTGVNQAMGGKRLVINGTESINPMQLKQVSEDTIRQADGQLDPFKRKLNEVLWFFDRFYRTQGDIGQSLNPQEWATLQQAIVRTYRRDPFNITHDISTHSSKSPTIMDLRDTLKDWVQNPEKYTDVDDEDMVKQRKQLAQNVLISLDPFNEGGQYHNLAQPTELDLGDEQVTYIDMQQLDGRGSDLGLMMQLVFSYLYQEARESDDPWRITVDECHKILGNSAALDFFEEVVRSSRHFDISFQWITQTFEEFFHTDEATERESAATQAAEVIVKQCGVKLFHRISPVNEAVAQEYLDLSPNHINTIENVHPGEGDKDYSEALLDIDESGYSQLRIRPTQNEFAVLEFDRMEDWEDLPNPKTRRMSQLLRFRYDHTTPMVPGDTDTLKDEIRQEIIRTQKRIAQVVVDEDPEALSDILEKVETAETVAPDADAASLGSDEGEDDRSFGAAAPGELNPVSDVSAQNVLQSEAPTSLDEIDPDTGKEQQVKQELLHESDENIKTIAANTEGIDEDAPPEQLRVQLFTEGLGMIGENVQDTEAASDD